MNQPEIRVTAYRYAYDHGFACTLEWLAEIGLRAARLARWYGIPEWRIPEGEFPAVHTWPGGLWCEVIAALPAGYLPPATENTAPQPYRVLVTGSRTWGRPDVIWDALADVLREHPGAVLVSGHCPDGADHIAEECWVWLTGSGNAGTAEKTGRLELHPADWSRGRGAGLARNAEMVAAGAARCLLFAAPCVKPGCRQPQPHDSHEGAHCATLAAEAGIPVTVFRPEPVPQQRPLDEVVSELEAGWQRYGEMTDTAVARLSTERALPDWYADAAEDATWD